MFPAVGISSALCGSNIQYKLSSVLVAPPVFNFHKEMEMVMVAP